MAFDREEFLTALDTMTVMELNELVKAIEEKFGVSAVATNSGPVNGPAVEQVKQAEQTEFNVMLVDIGAKKVDVIKAIREITLLGLVESKKVAESAPIAIKEGVDKATAESIKKRLEEVGAKVELK